MAANEEIKDEMTSGEGGCEFAGLDEGEGSMADLAVEEGR